MISGSSSTDVHYNYGGIEEVKAGLDRIVTTAQALLDAGRANRASLQASWDGTSGLSFQDAFTQFEAANQGVIDIANRTAQDLGVANGEMAMTEVSHANMFRGV
ncbi:WXG100 family type VII secretion target [Mycobacterium sp. LTG2003]